MPGSTYFEGGIWDNIGKENEEMYNTFVAKIPFGCMARPKEITDAIVFMASQRASWISGATLLIDGV